MKRMGFRAGIVACLMLAGCGGGSDDAGGGTTPPPPPPPSGIGASGGTVTETSGAKVVIPSGALTANTDIKVTQTSAGAPALPAGITSFGQIFAFTPHGTSFAKAVTITVPFDPASVPAGTSVALYKTDAALTTWTLVPGATVTGITMSGDVTGFSDAVVATLPATQSISVLKFWTLGTAVDGADEMDVLDQNHLFDDEAGSVDRLVTYGQNLPFKASPAQANAFSSQDGKHYGVFAEAPSPDPNVDDLDMHTGEAQLGLLYTYRKNAPDATLTFTLSRAELTTIDPRGLGDSRSRCPWLQDGEESPEDMARLCEDFLINPSLGFTLVAWSERLDKIFYSTGGEAEIKGRGRNWKFATHDVQEADLLLTPASEHVDFEDRDSEVFDRVWDDGSFLVDKDVGDDGGASAFAGLNQPIKIRVPLDDVPVDSVFTIESFTIAHAINHVQQESETSAFLRDPLDTGGVSVEFTGLELVPVKEIPAVHKELHPCATGPDVESGEVRFTDTDFPFPETQPARGRVEIERVGGKKGEIAVQFETQDGTAVAGSDYKTTRRIVWFHDGQDGKRAVSVPLLLDKIEEPREMVNLKLTVVSGCASLLGPGAATLTILDDDKPPVVTPTFTLGGTVTGLQGSGLALRTNFINNVAPTADGPFTFPRVLDDGTVYAVSIETQPGNPAQVCTLTNGSGTIAGANVSNVAVDCVTPPPASGLDTSFGSQGKLFTAFGNVRALIQQADGKLLSLGSLSLTRLNADGTPDNTFGTAGKVDIVTGGSALDKMMAFVVQPDGKIIAVGNSSPPTVNQIDILVMRFNADGTLDTTFGTGGKVLTDFNGGRDEATGVMLQADGKIVVTGDVTIPKTINNGGVIINTFDQDFGLTRYLPDGTLDTTFGTGGRTSLDAGGIDTANAAAMQPDGSIVIVGRVQVSGGTGNPDMGIARFTSAGIPDQTFGPTGSKGAERIDIGAGVVPASFGGGNTDEALDVAIQPDGKILLAGDTFVLVNSQFASVAAVLRLTNTGAIEQNIGPIPAAIDRANGIALQSDGKIVIAGTGAGDFGLARFKADGSPDTSFGTNGLMTVDFFGGTDFVQDVMIQSDGRIVAGGSAKNGTGGGSGLVRVNP